MKPLALFVAAVALVYLALASLVAHADFMAALAWARHGRVLTALGVALLVVVRVVALVVVPPLVIAAVGTRLAGKLLRR